MRRRAGVDVAATLVAYLREWKPTFGLVGFGLYSRPPTSRLWPCNRNCEALHVAQRILGALCVCVCVLRGDDELAKSTRLVTRFYDYFNLSNCCAGVVLLSRRPAVHGLC